MLSISRGNCSITEACYGLSIMFGNTCWAPLLLWQLSSAVLCVWTPSYAPKWILQILTTLFKLSSIVCCPASWSHWLRTSRRPSHACKLCFTPFLQLPATLLFLLPISLNSSWLLYCTLSCNLSLLKATKRTANTPWPRISSGNSFFSLSLL